MCHRAFLSFRFGAYAKTSIGLTKLKEIMRRTIGIKTHKEVPELFGFEHFWKAVNSKSDNLSKRHNRISKMFANIPDSQIIYLDCKDIVGGEKKLQEKLAKAAEEAAAAEAAAQAELTKQQEAQRELEERRQ